ncbi:hypothetical protein JAAARDRAFT_189625 [Jaapia argillacea MUCL 33604]|uniref:BTB domain-containing protein n=1 Tax=Jaapia argillacea MUCL 33604 TaxID=933084 RepID=A0A067Q5F2_9AGAM|nr:hypothetical protein JAAARDRAFT_189625 [Jaapia argillacea MUCL 33604]
MAFSSAQNKTLNDALEDPNTIHDSRIWLDDGSIIVRTVTPTGHLMFKCHKSVLAIHSTVFRDMFSIPQPGTSELHEGPPVVDLPDPYLDVRDLLYILYDPAFGNVAYERHQPSTIISISGLLRLATKYDIPHIRSRLIKVLEADWSPTLEGWDRNEKEIRRIIDAVPADRNADEYLTEPGSIIRLAEDLDIPSVLPAAYYHLSRIFHQDASKFHRTAQIHFLTTEDFRRVIVGRKKLGDALAADFDSWIKSKRPLGRECNGDDVTKDEWECRLDVRRWWKDRLVELARKNNNLDPLEILTEMRDDLRLLRDSKFCISCSDWMAEQIKAARISMWNKLQNFFQIPDPSRTQSDDDVAQ